jgi:tRNA-binding protein
VEIVSDEADKIDFVDFQKIDIRAGTIISAALNSKARSPAFVLRIDFGEECGLKTSSAQITEAYHPDQLVGQQIIAVMNFESKLVAGVRSEVLVLAIVQQQGPTMLVSPTSPVQNGARLA